MRPGLILWTAALLLIFGACASTQKKAATGATPPAAAATQPQAPNAKVAKAQKQKKASGAALSCSNQEDKRIAEIKKKDSGCEVEYQKGGETQVIASDNEGTGHCEEVVAKIKKNLVAAGFTCE